jgi:hypothetical protein
MAGLPRSASSLTTCPAGMQSSDGGLLSTASTARSVATRNNIAPTIPQAKNAASRARQGNTAYFTILTPALLGGPFLFQFARGNYRERRPQPLSRSV